jgi:tetratricopeptide (TPR) repeat protein
MAGLFLLVFLTLVPVVGWSANADYDRAVKLVVIGEEDLDLHALEEAVRVLTEECQGPDRDPYCEYYLTRAYLAVYSYWSSSKGNDPIQAAQYLVKAERMGSQAALRRPNDASVHVLVGKIYQIILVKNYVSGITSAALSESPVMDHFSRALELDPQNGEAEMGLGIYFMTIPRFLGGDFHRARQHFKRAVKLMPESPEPLVWISRSYLLQDSLEKARIYLDRALALFPENYSVQMEDARLKEAEGLAP